VKEKNVLLFKFRCNIFIGVRIIKEMPGLVASGTLCTMTLNSGKGFRCGFVLTEGFMIAFLEHEIYGDVILEVDTYNK
jgi:hypothetical protein